MENAIYKYSICVTDIVTMSTAELKSDINLLLENTTDKYVLNIIYGILSKSKKSTKGTISLNASEKKAVDDFKIY